MKRRNDETGFAASAANARRSVHACLRRKISGPRAEPSPLRPTAENPGDADEEVPNVFSIAKTATAIVSLRPPGRWREMVCQAPGR
jgi:hypothetical protein